MKIVHARKRVFDKDNAFEHKFTLLVWILSILKWKEYGHEVVLYTDNETLEKIKEFGFDTLYDEINTELFEKGAICEDIDFNNYWAMPKIIALHYETEHLGNKVLVADQDVVPMKDLTYLTKKADCLVWSNREYLELKFIYPEVYELSLAKDYELPKWFSGYARPLNSGVLYFRKNKHAIEFCDEVFKYVKGNKNDKNNSRCIAMCNAEQRMLGEYLAYKDLTYCTVQPNNQGLFNKNAFHTHGFKTVVKNSNGVDFNCNLLLMIKKLNLYTYLKLIDLDIFNIELEYINKNKYINIKQLEIY